MGYLSATRLRAGPTVSRSRIPFREGSRFEMRPEGTPPRSLVQGRGPVVESTVRPRLSELRLRTRRTTASTASNADPTKRLTTRTVMRSMTSPASATFAVSAGLTWQCPAPENLRQLASRPASRLSRASVFPSTVVTRSSWAPEALYRGVRLLQPSRKAEVAGPVVGPGAFGSGTPCDSPGTSDRSTRPKGAPL